MVFLAIRIGMDPDMFRVGNLVLTWHGFFTFVSVALAVYLIARWARRSGMSSDVIYSGAIWAIIGGIIGARVLHVIDYWSAFYQHNPGEIIAIWNGGIAIYGAMIGGFIGGFLFVRWRDRQQRRKIAALSSQLGEPVVSRELGGFLYLRFETSDPERLEAGARQIDGQVVELNDRRHIRVPVYRAGWFADLCAPALILAMAIGRIGDIINGEHIATTTSMPWGFIYTHPDSPSHQRYGFTATHPAVAYEMIWDLVIFGILWYMRGRILPHGMLYALGAALYATGRFMISFLRLDREWLGPLDEAQIVSIIVLAITVPLLVYRAQLVKATRPTPTPRAGTARRA